MSAQVQNQGAISRQCRDGRNDAGASITRWAVLLDWPLDAKSTNTPQSTLLGLDLSFEEQRTLRRLPAPKLMLKLGTVCDRGTLFFDKSNLVAAHLLANIPPGLLTRNRDFGS